MFIFPAHRSWGRRFAMSLRPTCAPRGVKGSLNIKWYPILKTPTPNKTKPSQANNQTKPPSVLCVRTGCRKPSSRRSWAGSPPPRQASPFQEVRLSQPSCSFLSCFLHKIHHASTFCTVVYYVLCRKGPTMHPRLALNWHASYLCLLRARIMAYQAQLFNVALNFTQ